MLYNRYVRERNLNLRPLTRSYRRMYKCLSDHASSRSLSLVVAPLLGDVFFVFAFCAVNLRWVFA